MTPAESHELLAEVRALRAREEIRNLVARYGMAVDDRDIHSVAACFADAGCFRYADGSISLSGREGVLRYYEERLKLLGPSYHYPHSQLIELETAGRARGIVNAHAELALPSGDTAWVALRYHDRYVQEAGAWRFEERVVHFLYYMRLADLPTGLASALRKRMVEPHRPADIPEGLATWHEYMGS